MKYRVEATDQAEAIAMLFAGEAEPLCQSQDFIEVADEYGLLVDQNQELADQLRKRGIDVDDGVIPSIRSVEKVQ